MTLPTLSREILVKLGRLQSIRELRLVDMQKKLSPLRTKLFEAQSAFGQAVQRSTEVENQKKDLARRASSLEITSASFFVLARARAQALQDQLQVALEAQQRAEDEVSVAQAAVDNAIKQIVKERHRIDSLARKMDTEHLKHQLMDEQNSLAQDEPNLNPLAV